MGARVERGERPDYDALAAAGGIGKPGKRDRGEKIGERNGLPVYKELAERSPDHARKHGEDFGPQAEACRTMPCLLCGAAPPPGGQNDPHHEPPRPDGDDSDTVPLCRTCHDLRHSMTWQAFWTLVGISPADAKHAVRSWMRSPAYLRQQGGRA